MRRRLIPPIGALLLISAACSSTADSSVESSSNDSGGVIDLVPVDDAVPSFGAPPDVPDGPLADTLATDLDLLFSSLDTTIDIDAIARIGASGDARAAWLLTDLLRFVRPGTDVSRSIVAAWEDVTGRPSAGDGSGWGNTTSHLIAWDTPAPPDYGTGSARSSSSSSRAGRPSSTTRTQQSTGVGSRGAASASMIVHSIESSWPARRAASRPSKIPR